MGPGRRVSVVAAALAAFALTSIAARADDAAAWLRDRQGRFAAYRAAHPNPDAEIAGIKAKTAALVAAAGSAGALQAAVDRAPLSWRVSDKPLVLWDGPQFPQMIVIPAGEFTMGSKVGEYDHRAWETPRHRVRIANSFAVGQYPVTVGEFARFVAETGYDAGDQCFTSEGGQQPRSGRDWRRPSFDQTNDDPVGCLNYGDTLAYVAWLSKKTGHAYRLLSEAEAEYVNRAGSTTVFWWGDDPAAACAYANGADLDAQARFAQLTANSCHDGYVLRLAGRRLQAQRFRPVRHDGRCLVMAFGLLERDLRRRPERRVGQSGRRLQPAPHARRVLERASGAPALGPAHPLPGRRAGRRSRVPDRPNPVSP